MLRTLGIASLLTLAACSSPNSDSQDYADTLGPQICVAGQPDPRACDPADAKKTTVCHIPPGNPANFHTICVGNAAVPAHLAHGDHLGSCCGTATGGGTGTGGGGTGGG